MGLPFQKKYADVQWESNAEHFEAWTTGCTGVPIVDAGIRQANTMGVLPNLSPGKSDPEPRYFRLDAQSRTHDCRDVFDEGPHD